MARVFDEEGLRGFTEAGEGSPPPVFVGREIVISDILAAAERAWRPGESCHGEPKMTRIVHGAPGSGKSSVLSEIQSRCRGAPARPGAPRALILNSVELTDVSAVLQRLAEAVNPAESDCLFKEERSSFRLDISARPAGIGGGTGWDRSSGKPAAELTLAAFARWAAGWNSPGDTWQGKWDFPLIVAVDEAQRLPPDHRSPEAAFIQSIHDAAFGLPLPLVLAGLGDTPDVAGKMGLTRGLTQHPVGGLSDAETGELMRGFCGRFGIKTAGAEERLAALAAPCEGWPRHLHFALQAFGSAALEAGGDAARIGWNSVFAAAAGSRRDYYRAQQDMAMRESGNLVGAVMFELDRNLSAMEIISLIKRKASDSRPEGGWSLPPGTDARSFNNHLVHQGALQSDEAGRFRCPIPSFRNFLIDEGMAPGAVLLYAASRGDERRAERALEAGAATGFRGLKGLTPLHVAAGCGRAGMVRLLLDRGTDPSVKDSAAGRPLTPPAAAEKTNAPPFLTRRRRRLDRTGTIAPASVGDASPAFRKSASAALSAATFLPAMQPGAGDAILMIDNPAMRGSRILDASGKMPPGNSSWP